MTKSKRYSKSKNKKRDRELYSALNPSLNLKTKYEEIAVDYLNKLSQEEKEWLNKFNEEYVNATLDRKNLDNNIHNTKPLKQSVDKRNNERKECFYTREKASGNLRYISDFKGEIANKMNYEDYLIDKIDDDDDL